MTTVLDALKNFVGAGVTGKQQVGGRLGINISRTVPTTFKDKVSSLQGLPSQASDRDVVNARGNAVKAEETVYRLKKISEQKLREAEAWIEAHEILLNHQKGLIGIGSKAAFKDASYLKSLSHYNLLEQEAEVEVTTAHEIASGAVNSIWN